MKSGVRKSGWPIPRLMMSRPCAASALARASTAKAFSSPMRSKLATVFSMVASLAFPGFRAQFAAAAPLPSTAPFLRRPDLDVHHLVDLENDGDRYADQQQAVERGDRPD